MSELCLAADRCRGYDPTTDTPADAAHGTPLCQPCLATADRDIPLLTHDYRDLEQLLPKPISQWDDGMPGHTADAPIPLRLDVEALQAEIWWLATTWAEILTDRHHLHDPPNPVRHGHAVQWAVRILAPRTEALARIPPVQLVSYPRADPDTAVRFRSVQLSYIPGAQGLLDLSRAHQRARHMLGLTEPVYTLPGYCQARSCGRPALRVDNGGDTVWCERCGAAMTRDDYDRLGNLFLRPTEAA